MWLNGTWNCRLYPWVILFMKISGRLRALWTWKCWRWTGLQNVCVFLTLFFCCLCSQHHWWLCCTRIPLPRLPSCPWESWYFWVAVVFYPVSSSELVQSKGSVSGEVILPCGTRDRGSVFGSWWWSLRHLRGRKGLQWRCWGCLSCRTGHNFSWQNPSRVLMFFLSKVQLSDPLRRTGISTALHTLILM